MRLCLREGIGRTLCSARARTGYIHVSRTRHRCQPCSRTAGKGKAQGWRQNRVCTSEGSRFVANIAHSLSSRACEPPGTSLHRHPILETPHIRSVRCNQSSYPARFQGYRAPLHRSDAIMAERYIPEHRRTNFKAKTAFKPDELRRRREEQQVEIRKQKREENLAKRRGIGNRGDGAPGASLGAAPDSDDEGANTESQVHSHPASGCLWPSTDESSA